MSKALAAQWTWVGSAPGHHFRQHTVYGSEGALDWNLGLVPRGGEPISNDDLMKEFTDSLSDSEREYYFPGGVEDTVAIELKYFADAIRSGGKPEVDAVEGMRSEAICMAVYESGMVWSPCNNRRD